MFKFRELLGAVFFMAISVVGTSFLPIFISAQENNTGSGLIISPTRSDLEIPAGSTDIVNITLSNVSGGPVRAEAVVNDFEASDETGTPKIIPDTSVEVPNSIRKFITNLEDINLDADERRDLELKIDIPANTPAGAYYGVVRYTAIPVSRDLSDNERQIALSASLGTIVLITVPGEITEQARIESLEVLSNGKSGSFFTNLPNQASVRVKNEGNGFIRPFGNVQVFRGSVGSSPAYSYELNNVTPKSNVLPGSIRAFIDDIDLSSDLPGRYTVVANISYSNGGEVITKEISFWYVPVWFLCVLAGLAVVIIAATYVVYRRKFAKKRR